MRRLIAFVLASTLVAPAWAQEQPLEEEPTCPPGAFCENVDVDGTPPVDDSVDPDVDSEPADPEPSEPLPQAPVYVETSYNPSLHDDRPTENRSSGVASAGLGIFLAGYTVPFVIGLVGVYAADSNPDALPLAALMVPVGGPLITGAIYEASTPVWTVLGVTSGVQTLGLIVTALGLAFGESPRRNARVAATVDGLIVRF